MSKGNAGNQVQDTPERKALADISRQQYDRYKKVFEPLSKDYLAGTEATPERLQTATGMAATGVKQGVAKGLSTIDHSGIDPANTESAAFKVATNGAAAAASADNNAAQGVESRDAAGKLNYINMGRGIATNSIAGLSDVAGKATSDAITSAEGKWDESNQLNNVAMTGLGAYTRYKTGGIK